MEKILRKKRSFAVVSLIIAILSPLFISAQNTENENVQGVVVQNLFEKARKNDNWKTAYITGEQEQIVFMNISSRTNPNNEIGSETHTFDQAILIVEGTGQSILNGKTSRVKSGDLIFIPNGMMHNVVNQEKNKSLKIISFYSATDIPEGTTYKTKADQPND